MREQCRLSNVTKEYLAAFYRILEDMIHGMTGAQLNDSISHNFIVQMIPHHRAAIEMSKNILKYTTNIPLQKIASDIIVEQTKSIEAMTEALCSCDKVKDSRQDLCLYQRKLDQILQNMFTKMDCARYGNDVNCNFMWEMIPHHMGAVEMSRHTLQFDICCELKPILEAIIASQERGICKMQALLKCNEC